MRGCGIAWGNAGPRIPKWVTSAFPLASFTLTQKSGAAMAQFFSLWNGGHCRLLLKYTNLVTEVCYSGVLGQKALGMEEMNMVWGVQRRICGVLETWIRFDSFGRLCTVREGWRGFSVRDQQQNLGAFGKSMWLEERVLLKHLSYSHQKAPS